ncbi:MAG: hypothetical protein M9962_12705 [Oligoflexia bacterium]|nr:hypothetical protein [Oligoflexia bacterium]
MNKIASHIFNLGKSNNRFFLFFLAAMAAFAPFYRILFFSDRALLYRDISRHFLAGKSLWANSVQLTGEIPYWNFYSYSGMPFWAENVNSPLHPLNYIFLLFSSPDYPLAMNYFVWIHYVFLLVGGCVFGKALQLIDSQRLVLGLLFSLGGVSLSAHNITHSLISFTAVPFFFACLIFYVNTKKYFYLIIVSLCIAWPIYGGDPQFTYLMAMMAVFWLLLSLGLKIRTLFLIGAMGLVSIGFSAMQLLPTLELVSVSMRAIDGIKEPELLSFSFHPLRLLEILWPQFYGNQYGNNPFWGGGLVNFAYKSPFLFSLYSGAMICPIYIFSLLCLVDKEMFGNRKRYLLHLGVIVTFFICFGVFSIVPMYEILTKIAPFFSSFRYPERLLFWPSILLWVLFILEIPVFYKSFFDKRLKSRAAISLFLTIIIYLIAILLILTSLVDIPKQSVNSILVALVFIFLHFSVLLISYSKKLSESKYLLLICSLILIELVVVQNNLIWDQSKNITDSKRYDLHKVLLKEIEKLDAEKSPEARKFSSIYLGGYQFLTNTMDHTTYTTFAAYEALIPNLPMSIGVEDVFGYYALASKEKAQLWSSLANAENFRLNEFLDFLGVKFLPRRDEDQKIILEKSEKSLPYVFIPEKIIKGDSFEKDLSYLKKNTMNIYTSALVDDPSLVFIEQENILSKPELKMNNRDGRFFSIKFNKNENKFVYLIWNESYDKHWHAYVGEKPLEGYRANAWAMAVKIPAEMENGIIEFRYENPLIAIGKWITGLSFFGFFLYGGFLFMQGHIQKRKNRSAVA